MPSALKFLLREKGILGGWISLGIFSALGPDWGAGITSISQAGLYLG
ncbi:MAG: hypothetical protein RL630_1900, partial [Verrucomicrobiota bacterium]